MTVDSLERNRSLSGGYNHAHYATRRRMLRFLLKWVGIPLFAKIDRVDGSENVPAEGPAILMMNHISFADSLVVLHLTRRNIIPLAKVEVYDYPVVGIFPRVWGVIPVRREEVDRRAIQQSLEVLKAGEIVLVAPEGTRHTAIRDVKEGAVYLSSRSGAPIVPVAIDGTVGFPALRFTRRWKGPGARVHYGRAFRYRPEYHHAGREQLRTMSDEAMYLLAEMLPPERRGIYADLSKATHETIEFI
jgi:1-acyl-sn-glycerol-3-phosphate acyltransferase